MKVCRIKDKYIAYLRNKDEKVLENKKEKRPYVGIVLEVNNLQYYVPLSSPKEKHKTMKNTKDFHKIANGVYGAINFNKMIPVKNECIIKFDFESEKDEAYKALLQNQYKAISAIEDTIKKKADNIYKIFLAEDTKLTKADLRVKQRCCNFTLLEEMCKIYNID